MSDASNVKINAAKKNTGRRSYSASSMSHSKVSTIESYKSDENATFLNKFEIKTVFLSLVVIVLLFIILGVVYIFMKSGLSTPQSTHDRVMLKDTVYQPECISDELDWVESIEKAEPGMRDFYDKTGVQPFIVLHAYDPLLKNDKDKEKYAKDWYNFSVGNENTFLFMYFAEENTDTDVGTMVHVIGKNAKTVMDDEAVKIFYHYVDKYWTKNISTTEMINCIYKDAAKSIMNGNSSGMYILKNIFSVAFVFLGVLAVLVFILLVMMLMNNKNKKSK